MNSNHTNKRFLRVHVSIHLLLCATQIAYAHVIWHWLFLKHSEASQLHLTSSGMRKSWRCRTWAGAEDMRAARWATSAAADTVSNRMSGLTSLITGATLYWMQRGCFFVNFSRPFYIVCQIFAADIKDGREMTPVPLLSTPLYHAFRFPPAFSCEAGEFLEMSAQECTPCAAGSYSLGSGIRFDQWDSMPAGFSSLATSLEYNPHRDDRLTCNRCAVRTRERTRFWSRV